MRVIVSGSEEIRKTGGSRIFKNTYRRKNIYISRWENRGSVIYTYTVYFRFVTEPATQLSRTRELINKKSSHP